MNLEVDQGAPAWRKVHEYIAHRIALHTETCTSSTATDLERRHACERIDELRMLQNAPAEAQRLADLRQKPKQTY